MRPNGLTSEEAARRRKAGQGNNEKEKGSRSYLSIFLQNLITPFNIILFVLGALLIVLPEKPDYINSVAAVGIIAFNVLVSTVQEMRAKHRLDKIAVLMRPTVTVLRDGAEKTVDRSEIVIGDIVHMGPGDQAQVDGTVAEERMMEMDESLLTGESSTRRKHVGDEVLSGSYCVTGECWYEVTKVGAGTFSSKMTRAAKKFEKKKTPLQIETNTVTEFLMALAFILLFVELILSFFRDNDVVDSLRSAVIILDIVPIALFLLITLNYMIASVRMADTGVLLQNSSSVESMSHVDTVCMDKTGTITTNRLVFDGIEYISPDREGTDRLIREFVSSTGSRNKTVIAVEEKFGKTECQLDDEVQFSSDRKFSAVRVRNGDSYDTVVVGAWPFLRDRASNPEGIEERLSALAGRGLRSVVFFSGHGGKLHEGDDISLPDSLEVIAVVSISDEVRPDCKEIIQSFTEAGIDIKVISGDDPETVDAIFKIAEIPGERKIISGEKLAAMSPEDFDKTALETNIFGRMRPEQKEQVVDSLRRQGRYVAMVGDGINDVRSIKKAQVGVAVQSGSGAARSVADMVLMNDNFRALPQAIVEGKRVVTGMRDILRLYLMRNFTLAFIVLVLLICLNRTPMLPIQNTLYALLTVSIMAFFMTIWAKPSDNRDLVLPKVIRYVLPTAVTTTVFALFIYCYFGWCGFVGSSGFESAVADMMDSVDLTRDALLDKLEIKQDDSSWEHAVSSSAMVYFLIVAGIMQTFLLFPVCRKLSVDGEPTTDRKPQVLAVLMLFLLAALCFVPMICIRVTSLFMFPLEQWLIIIAAAIAWFIVTFLILRGKKLDRITDAFDGWIRVILDRNFRKEAEKLSSEDVEDE
ncbi:HAD-IC family P-type ATPase [Methanomassiliicoccales archaeon LGM-DZ1]|nr:HAD-IC family P-type ATPase [Methanomassiliicoccales archaeon LGM-DZ1]